MGKELTGRRNRLGRKVPGREEWNDARGSGGHIWGTRLKEVVFDLVAQLPLARWTSSLGPLLSEQLWGQMR